MALKFSFTTPIYLKFFNPDWVSPDSLVEMAHIGEEVGFDEIAVYDHFLEPPEWQPSYATNSYDPMPLLGFLAAHTERIGIASATINIPYRNPAVMANELATIDKLSGGRLCIGLAAGYLHEEYDTLGLDFAKRGAIADEYLAAMIELWTNEYASFSGEHVSFNEVKLASFPVQKPHPEVWIHGGNLRALRRAIRYGTGWGPIVGPGISTDAGSTDFKIGSTDEGARRRSLRRAGPGAGAGAPRHPRAALQDPRLDGRGAGTRARGDRGARGAARNLAHRPCLEGHHRRRPAPDRGATRARRDQAQHRHQRGVTRGPQRDPARHRRAGAAGLSLRNAPARTHRPGRRGARPDGGARVRS